MGSRDTHDEAGFTLIELVVVMVIVAILMAIAVPSFRGGRKATDHKALVAAAQSYREAIEAFRLDHGGRVPFQTADWSNTVGLGPVDDLTTKPYMRAGVPDVVASGKVAIAGMGAGQSSTSGLGIRYRAVAAAGGARTGYELLVTDTNYDSGTSAMCVITNRPQAGGTPAC